jgi:hypothetical protein
MFDSQAYLVSGVETSFHSFLLRKCLNNILKTIEIAGIGQNREAN